MRLQGEGKFCWTLKAFSRLSRDERVYSPPFYHGGIAFMLLLFPRGNQQREYASLYVSVADKTKLPPSWRRQLHFSLCVVDQKESLCSVTKSTHGELSNSVLDWGFTELIPLATLHSPSHGYILDDTLQFTIQFERVAEDGSGRSSSTRPRRPDADPQPGPQPRAAPVSEVTRPQPLALASAGCFIQLSKRPRPRRATLRGLLAASRVVRLRARQVADAPASCLTLAGAPRLLQLQRTRRRTSLEVRVEPSQVGQQQRRGGRAARPCRRATMPTSEGVSTMLTVPASHSRFHGCGT